MTSLAEQASNKLRPWIMIGSDAAIDCLIKQDTLISSESVWNQEQCYTEYMQNLDEAERKD